MSTYRIKEGKLERIYERVVKMSWSELIDKYNRSKKASYPTVDDGDVSYYPGDLVYEYQNNRYVYQLDNGVFHWYFTTEVSDEDFDYNSVITIVKTERM